MSVSPSRMSWSRACRRPEDRGNGGIHDGLVAARLGIGTFVTRTLADATLAAHGPLRQDLRRWLAKARRAGLDDESIEALFTTTFRTAAQGDVA